MKRIILTGGSDGLGKAFGKLCSEKGIEIISLSRRQPSYPCVHIPTDLASKQAIESAVDIIRAQYGEFDALVNCAALFSRQNVDEISYEQLDELMRVNAVGIIYLTSQLITLIKSNEADLLNVGSTIATKPYTEQCSYGASKWALRGATLNFQLELAKTRCRVIQFNPGGMQTQLFEKYHGECFTNPDEWMKPADIADIIFYTLQLPKQVEISEILINRKAP